MVPAGFTPKVLESGRAVEGRAPRPSTASLLAALATSEEDALDLARIASIPHLFGKGEHIAGVNSPTRSVSILCEGLAKAYRILPDGGQQTVALFMAGDLMDLRAFLFGSSATLVAALTPTVVVRLPHARLNTLIDQRPSVRDALWRRTMRDNVVLEEWLVGLGTRSAAGRTAHVICEVLARLPYADVANTSALAIPLSQVELAEITGVTAVHMNRTLRQLCADGAIRLERGRVMVVAPDRLAEIGDFDAAYLGQDPPGVPRFAAPGARPLQPPARASALPAPKEAVECRVSL